MKRGSWHRHLPTGLPHLGIDWQQPPRDDIARALVEHPHDERVAYWQINEASIIDSMLRVERVRGVAVPDGPKQESLFG